MDILFIVEILFLIEFLYEFGFDYCIRDLEGGGFDGDYGFEINLDY